MLAGTLPRSRTSSVPLQRRDSSDAKKTAAGATWSGPRSGSAGSEGQCSAPTIGGCISGLPAAGHTMLARTPKRAFSIAVTLVSPRNANFDAVYALVSAVPCTESIEPRFTIAPRDARSIGRHLCVARNAPKQFTRMIRSNAPGVVRSMVAKCSTAALFTRTSRCPSRSET
jgi:hypothetical protein